MKKTNKTNKVSKQKRAKLPKKQVNEIINCFESLSSSPFMKLHVQDGDKHEIIDLPIGSLPSESIQRLMYLSGRTTAEFIKGEGLILKAVELFFDSYYSEHKKDEKGELDYEALVRPSLDPNRKEALIYTKVHPQTSSYIHLLLLPYHRDENNNRVFDSHSQMNSYDTFEDNVMKNFFEGFHG